MEMQIKFSEVLSLATLSSYSPTKLLKTSSLHHAIILALRPGCCRAMPGLDGFHGWAPWIPRGPHHSPANLMGTKTSVEGDWGDQWYTTAISETKLLV